MLLRGSGEAIGEAFALEGLLGEREGENAVPDCGPLLDYAEAVHAGEKRAIGRTRGVVSERLGAEAMVDAAAVIAIFTAVVRIADATGITLEAYKADVSAEMRASLGIDRYPGAKEKGEGR